MTETNDSSFNVNNTTSDTTGKNITGEVEVDAEDVKIFKIEELVPSNAPITIPYMEVYRTNELEYIPYISPYNVGASSSSDDSSSDTGTDTSSDSNSSDTDTNNSDSNSNSDDNSNSNNDSSSNNGDS